jgi:hypothetical protein
MSTASRECENVREQTEKDEAMMDIYCLGIHCALCLKISRGFLFIHKANLHAETFTYANIGRDDI